MQNGIGDIISGGILIGIGLTFGGPVFTGNPGMLDWLLDGPGISWIGRGVYRLVAGAPESPTA